MKKGPEKIIFAPMAIRSNDQLASAIKRIRKLCGYSQVELAKKTGLTQAAISRIESSNKKVEIGTMFLILAALSVEIELAPRPKSEDKVSLEGLF